MNKLSYTLGIDVGSTTVKAVILDQNQNILYKSYERHLANIQATLASLLKEASDKLGNLSVVTSITGSGGLGLANALGVFFSQEVVSVATALKKYAPQTDVAVELGGEDAKIIYFKGGLDQRMNGICAGGTGSFIDQMASLLQTDPTGLNELAAKHKNLYPIAARCGVFAKTDLQALLNEGAPKEDLAASIFQAVVNQTITALAQGKPIRGNVAFLGGPLHFLDQLKRQFIETLKLTEKTTVDPSDSHLFAAIGAALRCEDTLEHTLGSLVESLENQVEIEQEIARLDPLFSSKEEYDEFLERHRFQKVKRRDLSTYSGNCFLGIDAGSTTTKMALIDEEGSLLYSFYSSNKGNPIKTVKEAFTQLQSLMPKDAHIRYSCSTGYGEQLMKAALGLDMGEVETIAHYKAASFFNPDVDCIVDIGGQDMKCIRIKKATVDSVLLNEACSSGCGSFIETFAHSLDFSVEDFAKEALFTKQPVDLGSRCTVFMNSRVKQAQKEGATVGDISAGLAYSVIKNALFKVIKFTSVEDLGRQIVVQGGTFYNNAILRSFENITGHPVIRPDIAGIMGAFGAALIAREEVSPEKSSLLPMEEIAQLSYTSKLVRCGKCANNCQMTVMDFGKGEKFITGNKCERGLGKEKTLKLPNLFDYKYKKVFEHSKHLPAPRGKVGIPRVLNMYENFPFWRRFFEELGFSIVLSDHSSRELYELGMESIPSESECYPAKLVHGHIVWLIEQGCDFIFYPCVAYETKEFQDAQSHFNCPIVTSYAENIKNNVEELKESNVHFMMPFVSLESKEIVQKRLEIEFLKSHGIEKEEIDRACAMAWQALETFREHIRKKGEETLEWMKKEGRQGIVLAGRPYHIDPEIHHGIPELINSYGLAVLTEDSISHLEPLDGPLRVRDQWTYHSRLYRAAEYVKLRRDLNLIQLNSFGCGLDAVTTDAVMELLEPAGKIYTALKIDEVSNLGAARIRIRSLLAALKERGKQKACLQETVNLYQRVPFTKDMKEDYTILCPQMSPIHFDFVEAAINSSGYHMVVLPEDPKAVEYGLKYVNNDACYPSLIVIGQVMKALMSGEYDVNKVAVFMTQTGGGCRASNYIGFIRRALEKAGMGHVPVISVSVQGFEKNSGFAFTTKMILKGIQAVVYGDLFMNVLYKTRPYEVEPGSADRLYETWKKKCLEDLSKPSLGMFRYRRNVKNIVKAFDKLPIDETLVKPKVGVVGEILVKFLPTANNFVVNVIEDEGAEAVVPPLLDFFLYSFYNSNFKVSHFGKHPKLARFSNLGIAALEFLRSCMKKALEKSKRFDPPKPIAHLAKAAQNYVSLGNQTGEGWFLTGEIMELIQSGVDNIICTQPFACLPNHIVGKGVIKEIKLKNQLANIVAIDYDPGASEVNQLNRIKLMLSSAKDKLKGY